MNSLVSASYPQPSASPQPIFMHLRLTYSRPGLALLRLIFGQVASPHFGSASPQFDSSCDTALSQFGSSSAHLTSVQLLFDPASPQFSSSLAQPPLSLAPLWSRLASVWLLFGPALPQLSSSLAQLRLSLTHFSSTMVHAHLDCHEGLLNSTDTFYH